MPDATKKTKPVLALFDFDGTLTTRDSFVDFHIFSQGPTKFLSACAVAAIQGCRSLNGSRGFLKEALVRRLWGGTPLEDYEAAARRYAELRVEEILLPLALRVFLRHVELGHIVYIVTASMKEWIEPWASIHGVPVIGTELETLDGKLTGRLATPNCRGAEKVVRITGVTDLKRYEKIYAYGNSRGDREMLDIADEKIYRWDHVPEI